MVTRDSNDNSSTDILPLLGKYNKPLRLFTSDGRPVTDKSGNLLQNIVGRNLANIDLNKNIFKDIKDLDLVDAFGRRPTDLGFDPTTEPKYEENGIDPTLGKECHHEVYDQNGYPLTDHNGIPLVSRNGEAYIIFGPRGDPISDNTGKDVIDKIGNLLNRHKALKDRKGQPLYFFDNEGRPLTDNEGFPLLDITGMKMILYDARNMMRSLTGSDLYDAEGLPSDNKKRDFTKKPPTVHINNKVTTSTDDEGVAFDSFGYPLSDFFGNFLCFSNGKRMVSYTISKVLITYSGEPATIIPRKIYDRYTRRGFTNSSGLPLRLFDDYGRPLTDLKGVPQRHASGKLLIKFGPNGAPISDWLDRPLYDVNGHTNKNIYFRPCVPFNKKLLVEKLLKTENGVQYFECTGMPLTNTLGVPLLNAKEEIMIIFDKDGEPLYDFRKKLVYSALGLPITNSLDLPLIGPGGLPIRLYDRKGRPLTDSTGLTLKDVRGRYMIKVFPKGMGMFDIKGGEIYDKNGNPGRLITKFNACGGTEKSDKQEMIVSVNGEPMHLYDERGYPLTEQSGVVLYNRMGQSMIKCPEQGFATTLDDKPVFDTNGRKCLKTFSKYVGLSVGLYDKNSRPLTDRYGSVLHDRKGRELVLFDKNSTPVSAMIGGDLYDFKGMPLNHPFADPSYISKNSLKQVADGVQLFDCEDLPLTDSSGYLLYTSCGVPMVSFDIHGRVKCDHSGRPVFDVRGLAVSRTSGAWKDQKGKPYRLFDPLGFPLTDEDGKELYDISGKSLVIQDVVGRPKHATQQSYVRDAKGLRYIDIQFKPTLIPSNPKKAVQLMEEDNVPLRLYDVTGKPLTDTMGRPVINSKGEMLINMKNGLHRLTDSKNQQIYDRYKMPLGCSPKTPIKAMTGLPLLLYDDKGTPLTDKNGLPLHRSGSNEVMIVFDMYGRPLSTECGSKLIDHSGRCNQHPQFGVIGEMNKPSTSNDYGNLITVYDKEGRPISEYNVRS